MEEFGGVTKFIANDSPNCVQYEKKSRLDWLYFAPTGLRMGEADFLYLGRCPRLINQTPSGFLVLKERKFVKNRKIILAYL